MQASKRILVGVILGAHGIKGDVRLKSFTTPPEAIIDYGTLETDKPGQTMTIQSLKAKTPDSFLVRLKEVNDRTAAENLKGVQLYVQRDQLPEADPNEYYLADLEGLKVVDLSGQEIGTIRAVHNFGAGDIVEIALLDQKTVMIPFTQRAFPEVNLSKGFLVVDGTVLQEFKDL